VEVELTAMCECAWGGAACGRHRFTVCAGSAEKHVTRSRPVRTPTPTPSGTAPTVSVVQPAVQNSKLFIRFTQLTGLWLDATSLELTVLCAFF
jgi:hypothetical protein